MAKYDNPTELYITKPLAQEPTEKEKPLGSEIKSQRAQIMLGKRLHKEAKSRAHRLEISFNEYVNRLIVEDLTNEQRNK